MQLAALATFKKTAVQLARPLAAPGSDLTLIENKSGLQCRGGCDDGSGDTIIIKLVAESSVIECIVKMTTIPTVTVQVAPPWSEEGDMFTISYSLTVPRVVLHVAARSLAIVYVSLLVADYDLSDEDILLDSQFSFILESTPKLYLRIIFDNSTKLPAL